MAIVLYCDTNSGRLESVAAALQRLSHNVVATPDADWALSFLSSGNIDVVVAQEGEFRSKLNNLLYNDRARKVRARIKIADPTKGYCPLRFIDQNFWITNQSSLVDNIDMIARNRSKTALCVGDLSNAIESLKCVGLKLVQVADVAAANQAISKGTKFAALFAAASSDENRELVDSTTVTSIPTRVLVGQRMITVRHQPESGELLVFNAPNTGQVNKFGKIMDGKFGVIDRMREPAALALA